jgi:hypothetical protein
VEKGENILLELKETSHSYYCSESNYYVNGHSNFGRSDYEDFKSFIDDWSISDGVIDWDYNLCFRYDIKQKHDSETDEPIDGFELWLFFILQRKGIYRPVCIKNLKQEDMHHLEMLLNSQWEYMKRQWVEFSKLD